MEVLGLLLVRVAERDLLEADSMALQRNLPPTVDRGVVEVLPVLEGRSFP
jgi:hypothetical protein